MTEPQARRRVLLVGSGTRMQNGFLPALACLDQRFEIGGIHSRTAARLTPVATYWSIAPIARLAECDLSRFDLAVVSVPSAHNAQVLEQLQSAAAQLDLVIDTPIAQTLAERAECQPLLARFRSVTVAQDEINLPRYALIRSVVRQGLIGELRSITLYNSGGLHQGLALIRSFVGFARPLRSWTQVLNSQAAVVGCEFEGGFSGAIIGPDRRYSCGGIVVEGSEAVISEFPADAESGSGKPCYILSKVLTDGHFSGFEIRGQGQVFSTDPTRLRRLQAMNFPDKSDLSLERSCALAEVLESVVDIWNLSRNYNAAEAFHDGFFGRQEAAPEIAAAAAMPPPSRREAARGTDRWIANSATFLKTSDRRAAELAPHEKLAVAAGARMEADKVGVSGDHFIISGVKLDGVALPELRWYAFASAWKQSPP